MTPVKRYVLTEGSSLTDDLTGVDPGRCKWVDEGDVVGLVEALKNLLSASGATSAFDFIAAERDARNELARWQS